jgi:hypothetical protein
MARGGAPYNSSQPERFSGEQEITENWSENSVVLAKLARSLFSDRVVPQEPGSLLRSSAAVPSVISC